MKEKGNYISGIIGALFGSLVASIPWILMYVYGGMILSLLAIIIALGALKGYQLFKGKVDGKLPIIIIISSVIAVTVSTLLIIPLLLLAKEGLDVTIANLQNLYTYDKFCDALIKDYVISLLFTFLGIGGIVANIKKQIYEGKTDNIKVIASNSKDKETINSIKEVFIKLNALDKYSAVSKDVILNEIKNEDKIYFDRLKMQQIILKYRGNYYFSEKNEKSLMRRFLRLYLKILLVLILLFVLIFIIFMLLQGNK